MKVSELKTEMEARFEKTDARFDGIDARFVEMDRRITEEGRDTRRHFDVVAEQITSRVSALAETIAASNARCDRRLSTVESEGVTLLSALSDHELRLRVLEGARRRP